MGGWPRDHGCVGCIEAPCRHNQLWIRQRGRHLWSESVYWSYAWWHDWRYRPPPIATLHGIGRRLALVGMGTLFAGIIRAPMTSVLMIFETTQDYAVIVPLMISNLVSFFISSRFQPEPIYEALAVQDGIHLPSAATRHQRGGRQVVHLARPPELSRERWLSVMP